MKSFLLKRILTIFAIIMVLFIVLTSTIYIAVSRNLYANIKAAELAPKAETLSDLVSQYWSDAIPYAYFASLIKAGPSAWDAWVFVIDAEGQMEIQTTISEQTDPKGSFVKGIQSKIPEVLSGSKIQFIGSLPNEEFRMLIVGVPVYDQDIVSGAVFLAKPLYEVNAGINSLNRALFLSTAICLLIMIIPATFAINKLIQPLRETRDAAIAMAGGDFSVRATTIPKGEIGELAASFNLLAERLEKTISDLVTEKNRLIRILNGLAEGIIAVDVHCNVTHANPALWQLIHSAHLGHSTVGIEREAEYALVVKPNDPQFIRSQVISDESVWDDFRKVIMSGEPISRELVRGNNIVKVVITPISDEGGRTTGAVALLQDITEAALLEQTRKDYVANISHELRTPLTAMRGLIEPLTDGLVRSEDDRNRYYGIILRETMRLSRLIDDMLELSRLQAGRIEIERSIFDLGEVIESIKYKYEQIAAEKNISLSVPDSAANLPKVYGNADRIEQILVILIDNALKFTGNDGRISIDVKPDRKKSPSKLHVTVSDNGMGIEPAMLGNVFDRFFKADKARYGTAGTGLGLSIAKEILSAMGETISVKSIVGKGSSFTFTISLSK